MLVAQKHEATESDMAENTILRRSEVQRLSGATRAIIESLVVSGAVRPAIRGSKRVEHLFDVPGLAAINVYLSLRAIKIEAATCQKAATLAQKAGSDIEGAVKFGRTYLLVLPSGLSESIYTRDEAKARLASLADDDLGRAVVLNLESLWVQVAERVRIVLDERQRRG